MEGPLVTQSGHDAARPPAHGTKRTIFLFVVLAVLVGLSDTGLLELTERARWLAYMSLMPRRS